MRKIKVKFVDFFQGFNIKSSFIYKSLSVNFEVCFSNDPEYLFFSVFGDENLKYNDCIKIFYTGENFCPDFNLCDFAIGFEWLDFGDRYIRLPNYYDYKSENLLMMNRINFSMDDFQKKEDFCCFVYSNSNADPFREKLFYALNSYKPVNSGGRYLNNIGRPIEDKLEFQRRSKFCIACENTSHPGYTTEKLLQAYSAHTIPIYWGDPMVSKVFNSKSFINCHEYSSIDDIVKKVKYLDENDDKYLDMIKEPPLLSDENCFEHKQIELQKFLYKIIEQPIMEARRYNRIGMHQNYLLKLRDWEKVYNKENSKISRKIVNKISKPFIK